MSKKLEKDMQEIHEDLFAKLAEIVDEIGWVIAITEKEDDMVEGLIIGSEEYVNDILTHLGAEDDANIITRDAITTKKDKLH